MPCCVYLTMLQLNLKVNLANFNLANVDYKPTPYNLNNRARNMTQEGRCPLVSYLLFFIHHCQSSLTPLFFEGFVSNF